MIRQFQSVTDLLQSDATLTKYRSRLQDLEALLQRVRQLLPPTLAAHCLAVLPKEDRLVLFADSPAWSNRLRFFGSELAAALGGQGLFRHPPRIEVRVHLPLAVPGLRRDHPPASPIRRLSSGTALLLNQTAEALDDPELAAALRRLSRHRRREQN